jgi:type I restriction enzyme S subunit
VSALAQFDVFWMGELLRSMNLGQYSITAAQPGISAEAIRSLKIPIPPLSEQQLIGDFLRKKTARLSTLLGKKRELIVKLKEKRSALISRTVTKGLPPEAAAKASLTPNPNLKPSGIPWLGDIPEHWEVKKLSYITRMKSGETITSLDFTDDGIYPVFGGNGHRAYYSEFTHDGEFVLIGRQGALCGNINYAKGKFWASEHAIVVKPSFDLALFWLGELLRVMNLNQYSVWCGLCLRPTMIFARSVRKNRGDILRYIGMPSTRAFGLHRPPRC